MNSKMFLMIDNVLHTSNYGYDRVENPFIPFDEYIQDICVAPKDMFMRMLKEISRDEVSMMPSHMKAQAVKILVDWRQNYDVKKANHIKNIKCFPNLKNSGYDENKMKATANFIQLCVEHQNRNK